MIVRKIEDSFLLIRQHDHGQISGEFARHLDVDMGPERPTWFAIANHDVGWQELDDEVRLNPDTGEPYSFVDYPLEPKLRAYKHGLNQLEVQEPYASYLCSMHYGSFVRNAREPVAVEFRESEAGRRQRLEKRLPEEWLANANHNFRLLQLCDDLSLFVCLNEPGENEYLWYRDGFEFEDEKIHPVWHDGQTLRLKPDMFLDSFEFTVPYERLESDEKVTENGEYRVRVVAG